MQFLIECESWLHMKSNERMHEVDGVTFGVFLRISNVLLPNEWSDVFTQTLVCKISVIGYYYSSLVYRRPARKKDFEA